jgi:diguanylate cyclase (GGDEF)-like protein
MKAVIIGSAHLDILATVTGDDIAIDKIGRVSIDIGGTGANIAVNLENLGADVTMITAMNESPFSNIVREFMVDHGVKMVVETIHGPDAVFSAHIDRDGEMMSAISSMPVGLISFNEDIVRNVLDDADCLIMECNISPHELDRLTRMANEMLIPVFIAAVSEEKSLRIDEVNGKIDCVFLNAREAAYFRVHKMFDIGNYQDMANIMQSSLIVTNGADGALFVDKERSVKIDPVKINDAINFLGAGDAFMAATIFSHINEGLPMDDAARIGSMLAAKICGKSNCNSGIANPIKEILHNLQYRASTDILTGLVTRNQAQSSAQEIIDESIASESPVSVVAIDIDHFKRINDTLGHDAGDVVLKKVSDIIKKCVRDTDLASRWGGEEFIIVLPDTTIEMATSIAERIRISVETGMKENNVTVSCGVSTLTDTRHTLDSVIKRADEMLYAAKHAGRNRVVV